ncbi:MAG TPA: VWA domain-containing protein [Pyrinomonadaceae bacterium]|jgi:Ca-activated chloride channel family protein|nr:VWA domain-containing protein [Pyrinomonadaceae bacterium]
MMNERHAGRLLASLLLVAACGTAVSPAAPPRQEAGEVRLSVAVTGKDGAPIAGLPLESFALTAGKEAHAITVFDGGGGPASVAALFDLSYSMAGLAESRIGPAAEAVWRLASAGHEANEYRIVAFADEVQTVLAGSRDRQAVRGALAKVHGARFGRQSSLFDACWETLDALSSSPHAKRALILVSDGEDTYSRAQKEDILALLSEGGVVFYGVYLARPRPDPAPGATQVRPHGQQLLDKLAEVSGGLSCSPRNAKELDACFARIGEDLRARYVIGFAPKPVLGPGACRPLRLRVTPPDGSADKSLKVRAREEFCAPRPAKKK